MVIDPGAAFEIAPFPQWVVGDGRVRLANEAARRLFGWTGDAPWRPPVAREPVDDDWLASAHGHRTLTLQCPAGPTRLTITAVQSEAWRHFTVNRTDATRVLDPRFFDDHSSVAQLLDALPIGVYVMTAAGEGFYANRKAFEMLGRGLVASSDHLAEVYQAYVGETDTVYPVERMPIVRALGGESCGVDDMTLAHPDGRLPIEIWACPVHGHDGEVAFAIAAFTDISARRQSEKERQALQAQLVEASRMAGMADVATTVLHDVGNVLNGVKVSTEHLEHMVRQSSSAHLGRAVDLLEANLNDLGRFIAEDPKGQRLPGFLRKLATALADEQRGMADELAELSSRVLHMQTVVSAQQSAATRQDLRQRLDLAELLEATVSIHRHRLELLNAELHWDGPRPLSIVADRHKLMQVMLNLVANACDALAEVDERSLWIEYTAEANALRLRVRDSGPGVAPEVRDRIFQSGFSTKPEGHGFGLHSAANVVAGLGGSLRLLDAPVGATFEVNLPLYADEVAPRAVTRPE